MAAFIDYTLDLQRFLVAHPDDWEILLTQKPYCLKIKHDDKLVLFKYDQVESDFHEPIVRECRGIILEEGTWTVVRCAFFKFFNLGEELADSIDCQQVAFRLNRILPHDISVLDIKPVDNAMHARFSAVERTYHYYIHTRKDPFVRHYSCFIPYKLDFVAMNEAGRILTSYEDFGAFCKSHSDVRTTLCKVTEVRWECLEQHHYRLVISANRFLRNMVRALAGTLIDVGRGRISFDELRDIVESKKRTRAGESMPAHALFLHDVRY